MRQIFLVAIDPNLPSFVILGFFIIGLLASPFWITMTRRLTGRKGSGAAES